MWRSKPQLTARSSFHMSFSSFHNIGNVLNKSLDAFSNGLRRRAGIGGLAGEEGEYGPIDVSNWRPLLIEKLIKRNDEQYTPFITLEGGTYDVISLLFAPIYDINNVLLTNEEDTVEDVMLQEMVQNLRHVVNRDRWRVLLLACLLVVCLAILIGVSVGLLVNGKAVKVCPVYMVIITSQEEADMYLSYKCTQQHSVIIYNTTHDLVFDALERVEHGILIYCSQGNISFPSLANATTVVTARSSNIYPCHRDSVINLAFAALLKLDFFVLEHSTMSYVHLPAVRYLGTFNIMNCTVVDVYMPELRLLIDLRATHCHLNNVSMNNLLEVEGFTLLEVNTVPTVVNGSDPGTMLFISMASLQTAININLLSVVGIYKIYFPRLKKVKSMQFLSCTDRANAFEVNEARIHAPSLTIINFLTIGSCINFGPVRFPSLTAIEILDMNSNLWIYGLEMPLLSEARKIMITENRHLYNINLPILRTVREDIVIESQTGVMSLVFDTLVSASSIIISKTSARSVSFPSLVSSSIVFEENSQLQTVQLPKLANTTILLFRANPLLSKLEFPNLLKTHLSRNSPNVLCSMSKTSNLHFNVNVVRSALFFHDNKQLKSLSLPRLQYCWGDLRVNYNERMEHLNLNALRTIDGVFELMDNVALASMALEALFYTRKLKFIGNGLQVLNFNTLWIVKNVTITKQLQIEAVLFPKLEFLDTMIILDNPLLKRLEMPHYLSLHYSIFNNNKVSCFCSPKFNPFLQGDDVVYCDTPQCKGHLLN